MWFKSQIAQPERLIGNSSPHAIEQVMKRRHSKKLNATIVFYQPGCKDCRKVAPQILAYRLAKFGKLNKPFKIITINTHNKHNSQYIKKFSITKTPTFIQYDHGKVTRYSGTNKEEVAKLMDIK